MSLITISQDHGSGGKLIAQKVAGLMQVELYNDTRLKEEALKKGLRPENLRGIEEKRPGFFDRLLSHKPEVYLDVLQGVVYRVARHGRGIIFGHGSQILLKDFECALHIRIYATKETRIKNLITKKGLDLAAAERIIRHKDEEYNGFFRYAFRMDHNDPSLYDLIINTEKIGLDQAAKQIADLAHSDEIKACSLSALDAMDRRAVEKKIHAKLLQRGVNPSTIFIEVTPEDVAVISGLAYDEEEKDLILQVAEDIPEVSGVEMKLCLRSDLAI